MSRASGRPIIERVDRIVVTVKLKPNAEKRAGQMLAAGPPFDPGQIGLDRHDVYVGGGVVVFVFEGLEVEQRVSALIDDPVTSASFSAWAPLLAEEPRLAQEAYHWERGRKQ